jgi:hypothetical protein
MDLFESAFSILDFRLALSEDLVAVLRISGPNSTRLTGAFKKWTSFGRRVHQFNVVLSNYPLTLLSAMDRIVLRGRIILRIFCFR